MSNTKLLRGQMRQIVKELLPEILKEELYKAIEVEVIKRINSIEEFTKKKLEEMSLRHKETMMALLRHTIPNDKK